MSIDFNIALVNTLKDGKFPEAAEVKNKLQWISNRLHCTMHGIHGYCYYSRKEKNNQEDLDYIEDCMIQIIDAATFVLKTVRHLKKTRMGIKDPW